jgi:hypothetical protein
MTQYIPPGQTMNQKLPLSFIQSYEEKFEEREWSCGRMVGFSTRTMLQCTMCYQFDSFWQKKQVPVLHHAPYSPDLAPCDLFLFPKLKHSLNGTHFQSTEDIQRKTTDLLKGFTQNDFQKCFHTWKERMQHCIEAQGNYFEGNNLQHT